MEGQLMSLCEGYVQGDSSHNSVEHIASSILQGKVDVLELIQILGIYLTSTNVDTRCSATKLLSGVLGFLAESQTLLADDVHYLVEFYCDRLKDCASVVPQVLDGLHALVTARQGIQQADAWLISRSIFKEIYCQSLQFEERNKVFAILLSMLTRKLPALMECSQEFVLGYIQVLDGERDPRNLVLAFSSVLIILHNLDFDPLAESLFDVISCYFPIDFTPPPNDPSAVSRDALVQSLRLCLSATPKFAELCLPLLLEKLSSDVLAAKLDSLHTLVAAVPVYGPIALEPFLEQLWNAIKKEMFRSASPEVQLACVSTVKTITYSLSQPMHNTHLQVFISLVLQDCQRHLSEPELKLMDPVVQLLCGMTSASDPAAVCVIPCVIPRLLKQYSLASHPSHKLSLLGAMQSFIRAATTSTKTEEAESPLIEWKDSLFNVLHLALAEPLCKQMAIAIFSDLICAQYLLKESEIVNYCQQLRSMALSESNQENREVLGSALRSVCKTYPALVKEHLTLPMLADIYSHPSTAWLLPSISATPSLTSSVVPLLLAALHKLLADLSANSPASLSGQDWEGIFSLTWSLLEVVKQNAESAPLTPACVDSLVLLSQQVAEGYWKCCRDQASKLIGCFSAVLSHNTQHATESWCNYSMQVVMRVLVVPPSQTLPSVPPNCLCLPLLTALLAATPPSVVCDWGSEVCEKLVNVSAVVDAISGTAVAIAYASILNKHPEGEVLSEWVKTHTQRLWNTLSQHGSSLEDMEVVVMLWMWMTKALVMRAHHLAMPTALRLLELCGRNDRVGAIAADGFKLILSDSQDVLSGAWHANVKLFYKQQLFAAILPELVKTLSKVEERRKRHPLKVLSHFLTSVPQQVIVGELANVLPLLLQSLASEDTDVKISALNGVLSILTDTPRSFSNFINTILPCLLSLASDPSSMVIRRIALQCIESLCSLPTHLIYPHQQQVIRAIAVCLDDHKRLVRKAAVNARAKWFLL